MSGQWSQTLCHPVRGTSYVVCEWVWRQGRSKASEAAVPMYTVVHYKAVRGGLNFGGSSKVKDTVRVPRLPRDEGPIMKLVVWVFSAFFSGMAKLSVWSRVRHLRSRLQREMLRIVQSVYSPAIWTLKVCGTGPDGSCHGLADAIAAILPREMSQVRGAGAEYARASRRLVKQIYSHILILFVYRTPRIAAAVPPASLSSSRHCTVVGAKRRPIMHPPRPR
ncbi:hypothetical protein KC356_g23 [Hortaea werneckii]|nr:hypothetical protein KC356_g23 [Hortaea werneckii]